MDSHFHGNDSIRQRHDKVVKQQITVKMDSRFHGNDNERQRQQKTVTAKDKDYCMKKALFTFAVILLFKRELQQEKTFIFLDLLQKLCL
jgi:hypothetical protein